VAELGRDPFPPFLPIPQLPRLAASSPTAEKQAGEKNPRLPRSSCIQKSGEQWSSSADLPRIQLSQRLPGWGMFPRGWQRERSSTAALGRGHLYEQNNDLAEDWPAVLPDACKLSSTQHQAEI